ncbi:sugar porter family MFS transporter [Flavobacteriaceae bacterium]|jgi:sugar porter (SP) family MFS transporter|nr:sugar porter family MFS transporter [Flavobacterium sp.]MDA8970312.1 sugar porter family MFS transporter [Flavobacteriaceae bacterium]MDB0061340.1 sugar porter family MFS transporter [bacterium]MBT5289147.1 sugar porter family MFS transporter [Flavobacterium sp.]MBT6378234.1 sugar porter family MFS transporter [Flavobacterium sp.]|tara:strand:- start:2074 stop:3426 length:1353 start_codon:yes stop_codon:yes gene_type:complete
MNTKKLYYWSITVALAGFLFGFDTIVISGAEQDIQRLWGSYTLFGSNDLFHGIVIVGAALWGTVLGAIFGAIPNDRLGRKKTLVFIGVLYTISAIGSSMASDPWIFALFRFIGGIGVGASTIAAPSFISEIAPQEKRGRLVATYQFNIVFGILIAFVSNALLAKYISNDAWRWMIGIEALPAIIYTVMMFAIPESPRWLITAKNNIEAAKQVFRSLYDNEGDIVEQVNLIVNSQKSTDDAESIFSKKYGIPLSLAFFIAFFNQFSGINAILYYANRIFAEAGLAEQAGALGSIGLGITNFVFTLLGMFLIDRLGRKQLLYIGSVGYIVSLSIVSLCFYNDWSGMIVPISLFAFIASHAIGQGAVIWVFISEIFPNHLRSSGQAFGSSVHWVLAAIIPSLVPILFNSIGAVTVFAIFAFMMLLQLVWIKMYVPETKGKSLEAVSESLTNSN